MALLILLFPLLFLNPGLQGDGEMLEFFDGAPGDGVGVELEVQELGERVEDAQAIEPGQAAIDEGNHLRLALAGDMDVDDMTQLPAIGGDDFAAYQVLNANDVSTGARRLRCL